METEKYKKSIFETFSLKVTRATGSTTAFLSALAVVLIWLATGSFFHYSETWQLIINTGTTIITFLMVFLIQKSQNKDSLAIQLKLNELVASHKFASNRLIDIEDLTEEELLVIQKFYAQLAQMTKKEENLLKSHSIDEAQVKHARKREFNKELIQSGKS
jgi:low affinity Fe/Cu permease